MHITRKNKCMTLEKLGRESGFRKGGPRGGVQVSGMCDPFGPSHHTVLAEKIKKQCDVECHGCLHLSCTYLNHSPKYSNIDHHFMTVKRTVTQKHVLMLKIDRLLSGFLFYITDLIKVWVCPHSLQMAPYDPTQKAWVITHPKCTQHSMVSMGEYTQNIHGRSLLDYKTSRK